MAKSRTGVVYARFSSDLQKDRSVDDQVALCEQIARREGYTVVKVYSDRAKSGASMFERDGLLGLMTASKKRSFDAVIVESLDRLSRDQEDLAGIAKRLKFSEIKIITSEGETTDIHVGIRGIVGSLFLKDLGDKVRRGHNGRVREGKIPGTVTYGYRMVLGKPGEREIDPKHAAVVRRIFTEYANGRNTRDIAAGLTRDGIPTPSGGKHWNHQTFTSGRGGKRGLIGNQLYIGKLTWNANRTVMNPETGKKVKRRAKPEDVITMDVPHLQIIDHDLWERANGLCASRAEHRFGPTGKRPRSGRDRSVKNSLLAGLLSCGACGGHMRVAQVSRDGSARVACAAAHQLGTCDHRKTYDVMVLQANVLQGVKANLADPQALAEYTRAYHARWDERQKEKRGDKASVEKALNRVTVQIDRAVNAILDGAPSKPLNEKLKLLEAERVGLVEKLRLIEGESNVVSLHPTAIDKFAGSIEAIHAALTRTDIEPDTLAGFQSAFRNVFERIVVHPTGKRMPYEVTPYARLSAIMGVELFPTMRSTDQILEDTGFSCTDYTGSEKSVSS